MENIKKFFLKNKAWSITTMAMAVIIAALTVGLISSGGQSEIEAYQQKAKELETSVASLNEERLSLENKNAELSGKVSASNFNERIEELTKYKDTYKELESKYNSLKADYDKVSAENVSLKEKAESIEQASNAISQKASASTTSSNTTSQKAGSSPISSSTSKNTVSASSSAETDKSYTVYITNTGGKYHSGGCRYLKKSKISISKSKAEAQGYSPCKVCKP